VHRHTHTHTHNTHTHTHTTRTDTYTTRTHNTHTHTQHAHTHTHTHIYTQHNAIYSHLTSGVTCENNLQVVVRNPAGITCCQTIFNPLDSKEPSDVKFTVKELEDSSTKSSGGALPCTHSLL